MADYLPCIEIEPAAQANAAIIWLHGLGADAHDFEPIVPELHLPAELNIRFVFPNAPSIPITINNGYVMPAWFDILKTGGERDINVAQLLAASAAIHKLIDREVERGIDSERIVLAGFSQGGAVCLQAGLTYDKPLAGIMGLSTFFPSAQAIEVHPANSALSILLCHGTEDPVLDFSMAQNSKLHLEGLGFHPDFLTYSMGHTVVQEEIRDLSDWIQKTLS